MKKSIGVKPAIYPMPVLIIAAYGEDETPDAMNAAWGGICGRDKIMMCITPTHKTVKSLRARGAFTVGIADAAHMLESDYVGIVSGNDEPDKVRKAGFRVTRSDKVYAPIIDELPMTLECEVESYDDPSHILIGKIVDVKIEEDCINPDGSIDLVKLDPITFDSLNAGYVRLGDRVGTAFEDGKKLK